MDVINSPFSVWESRRTSASDAGPRAWGGTRALPLSHQTAVNCALTPPSPSRALECVSAWAQVIVQSRWGGGKGRSREAGGFVWAGQWQKAAFQVRHRLLWGNVLWDSSSVELGFVSSPTQPFQLVSFLGRVWSSLVSLQVGGSQLRHICASCPCQVLLLSQPCPSLTCPALCSCFNPKQLPLLFLGWFME